MAAWWVGGCSSSSWLLVEFGGLNNPFYKMHQMHPMAVAWFAHILSTQRFASLQTQALVCVLIKNFWSKPTVDVFVNFGGKACPDQREYTKLDRCQFISASRSQCAWIRNFRCPSRYLFSAFEQAGVGFAAWLMKKTRVVCQATKEFKFECCSICMTSFVPDDEVSMVSESFSFLCIVDMGFFCTCMRTLSHHSEWQRWTSGVAKRIYEGPGHAGWVIDRSLPARFSDSSIDHVLLQIFGKRAPRNKWPLRPLASQFFFFLPRIWHIKLYQGVEWEM